MAKALYVPTRSDLEALVPEIVRVINQSYAFLLWFTHVFPALDKKETGFALVVRNNLFEGTLLNLRKLNEFFTTGAKREDDARADDFPGFAESATFLTESDLKEIHKRTAHLTYHAVRNGPSERNMANFMEAALKGSLPFLDYLIRDFYTGATEKSQLKLVIALRNAIPRVLHEIENRRAAEEANPEQPPETL